MKVNNIWFDQKTNGNYGLIDKDGKLYRFKLSPFRNLEEKDLSQISQSFKPYIQDWWEMKPYEYRFYGVER